MADIETRVYRSARVNTVGGAVFIPCAIGAAILVAVALDAGPGGWVVVGAGMLIGLAYFVREVSATMDRHPQLIIDAEGIRDLRPNPPVGYDWADYRQVIVNGPHEGAVALELVDRSGVVRRVTISAHGLDAKPEELAEVIEDVWEEIETRRGTGSVRKAADGPRSADW